MNTLYARLLQDLPHGAAFVVDHQLRYVLAGGEALGPAGLAGIDLRGKSVAEVVPPALAADAERDYRQALAGGTFHREHAVGGRQFVTHGKPVRGPDGSVVAALAVSYDVTGLDAAALARGGAEPQPGARELALSELNRRKDVFLATFAHELRNVLAPLRSGVELLQMTQAARQDSARVVAMLDRQITQMSRLVEDLVDVARIAEGKLRLSPAWINVQDAVDLAVDTARPLLDAGGHALELAVRVPGMALWADPARLTQMLGNLLNNAAKFTSPGGRIQLRVQDAGDFVEFEVIDNGPGIASENLAKVFELYEQLGTDTNGRASPGLGIGLALVKRLAELHGGFAGVRSEGPGRGSAFSVSLPKTVRR